MIATWSYQDFFCFFHWCIISLHRQSFEFRQNRRDAIWRIFPPFFLLIGASFPHLAQFFFYSLTSSYNWFTFLVFHFTKIVLNGNLTDFFFSFYFSHWCIILMFPRIKRCWTLFPRFIFPKFPYLPAKFLRLFKAFLIPSLALIVRWLLVILAFLTIL